jgi:hypothetical protein
VQLYVSIKTRLYLHPYKRGLAFRATWLYSLAG